MGGTRFLGRTLVETALERGYELTLFNRGQTNPELFPEVEKLRGDRDGDLALLRERKWDVVVDTCGYVPRIIRKSAELLRESVEQYIFISTISVYADFSEPGIDENSPLAKMKDESIEEVTGETYGPLKVLCENVVEKTYPKRSTILRCGLIVGPYDPTDRFTYWPVRIQRGGEVLVPSPPRMPVQFIDATDLAHFILRLAKNRIKGIFNTTGPAQKLTMQDFLDTCNSVTGSKASLTWASEEFITSNDVGHVPMWTPKDWRGIFEANCTKAIGAGLKFKPLRETISGTITWHTTRPSDYELKAGLKSEEEKEVLRKWHDANQK
ncbi:SDR family oxidoreductase [candidate division WOR-3 bacterium]|nr:SDR family oxidoreductase [candidate division WOR-3 bacterium]